MTMRRFIKLTRTLWDPEVDEEQGGQHAPLRVDGDLEIVWVGNS